MASGEELVHLKELKPQRSYGTWGTGSAQFHTFIEHEVKTGETLVGLSIIYDLTVEDLKRANTLWTNDSLYCGQVLRIPVRSEKGASPLPTPSEDFKQVAPKRSASLKSSQSVDSSEREVSSAADFLKMMDQKIAANKQATKSLVKTSTDFQRPRQQEQVQFSNGGSLRNRQRNDIC